MGPAGGFTLLSPSLSYTNMPRIISISDVIARSASQTSIMSDDRIRSQSQTCIQSSSERAIPPIREVVKSGGKVSLTIYAHLTPLTDRTKGGGHIRQPQLRPPRVPPWPPSLLSRRYVPLSPSNTSNPLMCTHEAVKKCLVEKVEETDTHVSHTCM